MIKPVRIAVLDSVPRSYWADDEGNTDSQKFIDLLAPCNAQARFDVYYVTEQEFPQYLEDYDALLFTGSPASVHDEFDWIDRLSTILIEANQLNKRIVASCFGHQLVAKTFGGEVRKNTHGWVIGNYDVKINASYDWMIPAATNTGLYFFNQEHVTILPQGALSFAHIDEYADYGFTLGQNILSFQGHPEQPKRAMVNFLAATVANMPADQIAKAQYFIEKDLPDSDIWAQWIMRFITK